LLGVPSTFHKNIRIYLYIPQKDIQRPEMAGCQRDGWMQISFPGLKNETKIKHKLVVGMLQNPGE